MAIRDRFRRAVGSRKSTTSTSTSSSSSSSSSSTHAVETATIASSTESEASSLVSPATDRKSRARAFTWRPNKTADEKEQQKKSKKQTSSDPREKPFTEMNLRYQEILGSYELTFGTSHPEQLWNPDGELSPGTSRQNSLDLGRN